MMALIMNMKPRSKNRAVWFVAFAIAGVVAASGLSHYLTPKEIVPWRKSFTAAQTEAQSSGKLMLVDFSATWCPPCQAMKRTTWASRDVEQSLRKYVPVQVDVDQDPDVATKYGIETLPTLMVVDAAGNVVHRNTEGALDVADFLDWLNSTPTAPPLATTTASAD